MLLVAVAILLWSWVIRRDRLSATLPWVGAVVGIAGIATLFGGPAYISVHELLVMVLAQSVWMVWVGVLMMRQRGMRSDPADTVGEMEPELSGRQQAPANVTTAT
jgi:hypothetical protein